MMARIEWALRTLAERFARVVWVPGNHELWTVPAGRGLRRSFTKKGYVPLISNPSAVSSTIGGHGGAVQVRDH
jgi:hypothetical protein